MLTEIEDLLASEFPKTERGRLEVEGVYRLYLDICAELGRGPRLVYTGEKVIEKERLEELADEAGRSKEEVVNKLEVEV